MQRFSAPSISSLCPLKTFAAWQDARFGGICRGRHHSRYPIFLDASLYSSVSRFRRLSPFTIHVRTILLLLIALHTPPLRFLAPNDRQTRQDHTNQKALSERFVVRLQHCRRTTYKEGILSRYTMNQEDLLPILNLFIGLEVSHSTTNARRITLWEALKLANAATEEKANHSCTHAVGQIACLKSCWRFSDSRDRLAVKSWTSAETATLQDTVDPAPGDSEDVVTLKTLLRAAVVRAMAWLEKTGVRNSSLQAWYPFTQYPCTVSILAVIINIQRRMTDESTLTFIISDPEMNVGNPKRWSYFAIIIGSTNVPDMISCHTVVSIDLVSDPLVTQASTSKSQTATNGLIT